MTQVRDVLAQSQIFGGLPEEDLQEIEKIVVDRRFDKGEIIFFDGDDGDGFYLVAEGAASIYKLSPEGKEQTLHILRSGETVGAVPVFSGESFPANAQAIAKSRLLFFPRDLFVRLIMSRPTLTMNLLALLSARLRDFTIQVEALSLREIPARLAAYLLYLSKEQGNGDLIRLDISKLQLANLLGTGPESLSRALRSMKSRGLVEEKKGTIRLLNRGALEELAKGGKAGQ